MEVMHEAETRNPNLPLAKCSSVFSPRWLVGLVLLCGVNGCAALTNPVVEGAPVRRLPPELLGESRQDEVTIPLTLLEQQPSDVYLLGPGDVLGIWIEDVLGDPSVPPPLHVAPQVRIREQRR